MITRAELDEILYSATTAEPLNKSRWGAASGDLNRTLGEMDAATLPPARRKSVAALRRQIRMFLNELPEDMTITELRDLLEEV